VFFEIMALACSSLFRRRGRVLSAALGLVAAVLAWTASRDVGILVAGLLLGSAIPFTLLVILPTNKRLLDPSLDPSSVEAAALWGRLHAIRTIAGLAAFALLLGRLAR
jgi:uncharacterized membrane protein